MFNIGTYLDIEDPSNESPWKVQAEVWRENGRWM